MFAFSPEYAGEKQEGHMFGIVRKATKVVVYTAIPISGPLKAATMGTRNSRLTLKEQRKQTKLLEEIQRGQKPRSSSSSSSITRH
jgi:hypothetical protein